MPKSTVQPFLFAATAAVVASAALAGCGAPNNTVSKAPLDYGMTVVDKQTLDAVNCKVENSKIVCVDPADDGKQSKLDNLNRKAKLAADRKVAIDKVEASIRAALRLQKFNPNGKIDPKAFDESLVAESARQETSAKSLKDQSTAEQDYLTILGYHCEVAHDQKGSPASSTGDILMATPQPIEIKDEAASFVANIGLQQPNNQITYTMTDRADSASQKSLAFIQTDAEFTFRTNDASQSNVNCSHLRKGGSTSPFSDRTVQLTNYDCVIKSVTAGTPTTSALVIPVANDTQSETVPAADLSAKYNLTTSVSKGILTINIGNFSSNKTFAQASIPNSAQSLSVLVDSKDGNSISIVCAAKK